MLYTTTGTDLLYNIVEELLTGRIDGVSITAHAGSGGRAGSKTPGAVNMFIAWNPRDAVIVTGFPMPGRAVANGYPSWQNQIEVTR